MDQKNVTATNIFQDFQFYFTVAQPRKFDLLVRLIQREEPQQGIIFCRTKRGTDRVNRRLKSKFPGGIPMAVLVDPSGNIVSRGRDRRQELRWRRAVRGGSQAPRGTGHGDG